MSLEERSNKEIIYNYYIMALQDLYHGSTYDELSELLQHYEEEEMYLACAGIKKALDESNYLTLKDIKLIIYGIDRSDS